MTDEERVLESVARPQSREDRAKLMLELTRGFWTDEDIIRFFVAALAAEAKDSLHAGTTVEQPVASTEGRRMGWQPMVFAPHDGTEVWLRWRVDGKDGDTATRTRFNRALGHWGWIPFEAIPVAWRPVSIDLKPLMPRDEPAVPQEVTD